MSRIRTIKPEYWTSEQVVECSIAARLLFIGMWNFADDAGTLPASVKTIKMQVLPADNIDVQELINELLAIGLIVAFKAESKTYWNITGWKHQKISNPSYKYPALTDESEILASPREESRVFDSPRQSYPPEGKGREGKGISTSLRSVDNAREAFNRFWSVWPHKVGKPTAEKAFKKVSGEVEDIIEGVHRYIATKPSDRDWLNPATFLNQRRWEDQPAPPPMARAGPSRDNRNGVGNLLAEAYGLNGNGNQENHSQAIRSLPFSGDGEREPDRGDGGGLPGDAADLLVGHGFSRM